MFVLAKVNNFAYIELELNIGLPSCEFILEMKIVGVNLVFVNIKCFTNKHKFNPICVCVRKT